jgi:biotin carboxyl carrier protein
MKLFHSVPASVAGSVIRILAADGTAVAQGQPLIAIRPTATA